MTAPELVATLHRSGVVLTVHRDRLRIDAPRGVLTPELRRELAARKLKVIAELKCRTVWPPEALASERRFGAPEARLYPFLGGTVKTPEGDGRLLQVFCQRVAVQLENRPDRLSFFLPEEIRPSGVPGDQLLTTSRIH